MLARIAGMLIVAALAVPGQPPPRPLTATVSRASIAVGEKATITFSGGRLDVTAAGTIDGIGGEFADKVELQRLDRGSFSLKGLAPCSCALGFTDGQSKTTVKIRVVRK
jgi:hypothetical protein